jgi:hypothetical protein
MAKRTPEELELAVKEWNRSQLKVSMRQARLALSQADKLDLVNDAIAAMDEPNKTAVTIEWEYGSSVERASPWVSAMAAALSMTDAEMDDLFERAATL